MIHTTAEVGRDMSSLMAKVRAMQLAFKEARRLGFEVMFFEGDSKIVVNGTTGLRICPWEIDIIAKILNKREFSSFYKTLIQVRKTQRTKSEIWY